MKGQCTEQERTILTHLVSGAWTEEECCVMKRPCTEQDKIIPKTHVPSVAWNEEDKCYMTRPRIEKQRIILKHLVWGAWTEEGRNGMKG